MSGFKDGLRRHAVITGASGALGVELADALISDGWTVSLWSRSRSAALEKLLTTHSESATWQEVDITSYDAVRNAARLIPHQPELSLLVNNAGLLRTGLFVTESLATTRETIAVNLIGTLNASQVCARAMLGRGGSIINISSINAIRGHRGVATYSAAKAGIHGLTISLARELGPEGIRVNTLVPGYFSSDLSSGVSTTDLERIRHRTPLGRLGTTGDVVEAFRFLVSPGAGFITGQTLTIDGGLTC